MSVKIIFDNGLTGYEFRKYMVTSDARQYFLSQISEAWEIETDNEDKEISRKLKIVDGEQQYIQSNKRSHRDEIQLMNGYVEREGYDCNANSFKELADIKRNATKVIKEQFK